MIRASGSGAPAATSFRHKGRKQQFVLEDLCFQAQQAAEKSLKALLIARGCRAPYTHDLATLLRLIEKAGETIPTEINRVVRLTDYAVETRYPGLFEPVAEAEYQEALALATQCVAWVRGKIA